METTLIHFPDNILLSMNMRADEFVQSMQREFGLKMYREGRLTLAQCAELSGMNIYEFISLLNLSKIPVMNYDADELEDEVNHFLV